MLVVMIWWTGLAPWEIEFSFPDCRIMLVATLVGLSFRREDRGHNDDDMVLSYWILVNPKLLILFHFSRA